MAQSFAPPANPSAGAQDPRTGASPLRIGDVTLYSGETPALLTLELEQKLAVHDYPGGVRKIQRMGAFCKDFSWESRLRGTDAYCNQRSRVLAGYMAQGTEIQLSWETWTYLVQVRNWTMGWRNAYRNDYKITIIVVQDLSGVIGSAAQQGVDGQVAAYYSGAQSALSSINGYPGIVLPPAQQTLLSQINSNLAALGTSLQTAGSVATMIATGNATQVLSVLATVIPQVQTFLSYLETAQAVGGLVFQVQSLLAALAGIQKNVQVGQPVQTEFVAGGTSLYDLAARLFGDPSKAQAIAQAQNPPLLTMRIPPGTGVYLVIPPLAAA